MGPGTIRCLAHSALPMLGEAVRLVPLAVIRSSRLSSRAALRMALGAVAETAGITISRPILEHEGTSARASECRLRASIGTGDLSARRCAEHEKNLLFSASRTARAKQHASPQWSGAQFEQGYACLRPVRAVGCSIRACSDSCSTKGCRIVRLSILSVVIAFSQYFIILTCVRCVNTLFVPQERPGRR